MHGLIEEARPSADRDAPCGESCAGIPAAGVAPLPRIRYESRLVEEAVTHAVRTLSRADQWRFHQQREEGYQISDPDDREARFDHVHHRWFVRLALGRPLSQALSETGPLLTRVRECRVASAVARRDEHANLFDHSGAGGHHRQGVGPPRDGSRLIFVRLRPESFLAPHTLLSFLRHEFLHLADTVDPSFGYDRSLPASDAGPSYENVLRNRYRAVWDTTIDGRLLRRGVAAPEVRDIRFREFSATFPMLGNGTEQAFSTWFDNDHPTHQQLVAFILDPAAFGGAPAGRFAGRCPVCRFPTSRLDPRPDRLSEAARQELEADHPGWRLEQGLCSQCADLYLARQAR